MKKTRSIAILSGGGDCPGTNAVIRAVAKKAIIQFEMDVIGIEDGYEGLIHRRWRKLHYEDVSGILTEGGTILGTSNKSDPYRYARARERNFSSAMFRRWFWPTLKNSMSSALSA